MNRQKKRNSVLLLVLLLVLALSMPLPAFAGSPADRYEAIRTLAEQKAELLVQGYGTTSVQYALLYDGEILLSGSAGVYSRTEERPLSADTMYGIGSLSKMYPTAAILHLVDRGLVDLEEPVTAYLPEFTMADARYTEITVRMLLNHSSGLMGSSFRNAFLFDDTDGYARDNLLSMLSAQRLKADPGAFSVYCNDGFTLAELIVEEVSGLSFTDYLATEFFEPLGLAGTMTPESTFDRDRLARTYHPLVEPALPVDTVNVIGTGGVYSTAEEVVLFSEIFMDRPEGPAAGLLRSEVAGESFGKEYARGLWTPEHDNIIGFGLGWDSVDLFPFNRYGIPAAAKGGDTVHFHSNLILLPEQDMAMAVLSSGGVSLYNQTFATGILLEALKLEGYIETILPEQENIQPVPAAMPGSVREYAGYYGSTTMVQKIGIDAEGVLTRTVPAMPDVPPQRFVYTSGGVFAAEDGSGSLGFVTEADDIRYLMEFGYATLPGLGQIASMTYGGQKLGPVSLTEDVQAVWNQRDGRNYYVLNEKYTSQVYLLSMPKASIDLIEGLPGYVYPYAVIMDSHVARPQLMIPGMASRDLSDLSFYTEDGVEYLEAGASLLLSEDHLETLYTAGDAICTIQDDGYARWYRVDPEDAGKTILVDVPGRAAFAVYDGGEYVNFSLVSGSHRAVLTAESMVVFAGEVGSRFHIRYE